MSKYFDGIGGIGNFFSGIGSGIFSGIRSIGSGIGNIALGNVGSGLGDIGTGIGGIGDTIGLGPLVDVGSRAVDLIGSGLDFVEGLSIEGNLGGPQGITGRIGADGAGINVGGPSGLDIGSDDEGVSLSLGGERGINVGGDITDMTQLPEVRIGGLDLTGRAQNVVDAALGILPDMPSMPGLGDLGVPGTGADFAGVANLAPGVAPDLSGIGPISPTINPGSGIVTPPEPGREERLAAEARERVRARAERTRQEGEDLARAAELLRLERQRTGAPKAPLRGRTSQTVGSASPKKSGARLPRAKSSALLGLGNQPSAANRLLG